jgi:hypothetical protein
MKTVMSFCNELLSLASIHLAGYGFQCFTRCTDDCAIGRDDGNTCAACASMRKHVTHAAMVEVAKL